MAARRNDLAALSNVGYPPRESIFRISSTPKGVASRKGRARRRSNFSLLLLAAFHGENGERERDNRTAGQRH